MDKSNAKLMNMAIIIGIMIIVIIIIIIVIIVVNEGVKSSMAEKTEEEIAEEIDRQFLLDNPGYSEIIPKTEGVTRVQEESRYYTIQNNIVGYYVGIIEKKKEFLYNILDKEFTELNDINVDNIVSDNESELNDVYFVVEEMYVYNGETVSAFYVYGKQSTGIFDENFVDAYFTVYIDYSNTTYSIRPSDKEEYDELLAQGQKLDEMKIEKNTDNAYVDIILKDETVIANMLYEYKNMTKKDIESSFELLDKTYSEMKFENVDEYIEYVQNSQISTMMLKSFQIRVFDDYTEYICQDQNDNMYIIQKTAVMQYSIMLDVYTVGTTDNVEEYKQYDDVMKAKMNIAKIITAINNNHFEYAYTQLDETFKINNFPTIEEFTEYMLINTYTETEVKYTGDEMVGEIHVIKVTLKNAKIEGEEKTKEFMIKLVGDLEFVYSFSI